jgi:hypothetical protein
MDRSEAGKRGWEKTGHLLNEWREERSHKIREAYELNPKLCQFCGAKLPFEKRRSKFCNHSCSASFNNQGVTRHIKGSKVCSCGKPKKPSNKYCSECSGSYVYNKPATFEAIKDHVARKRFLIDKRGYRCESCQLETWLERPIPLELHHIDGDADNNTEENLQLVCPNCHAFTEHYKGAVKGKNSSRQRRRRERYAKGLTW